MNYFVAANIGIAFFYSIYLLVLRNETDFVKQRAFLIGGLLCSLFFPLITIESGTVSPAMVSTIILPELSVGPTTSISSVNVLLMIYLSGALVIGAPLLFQALRLYKSVKIGRGTYRDNYYVIESSENVPSWSFFKLIYIGRATELSKEDRELVVKHEMLHGQLSHSIDMLIATLLCIVFWFNPIAWLYRRTLMKVHEFQVDAIVANQHGVAPYTELLVKSALAGHGFLFTHHFNQSFILKRINMISTIKNRISSWKLVVLAMSVTLYFVSVSCSETGQQEQFKQPEAYTGEVFQVVSDPPSPVGGFPDFAEELNTVLKYPKSAKEKGIQGTVYVEFVVRPDGTMSDYKILKSVSDDCDNAALVAVSKLKKWNPGSHNGKPVAVRFVLPIKFQLD